MRPLALSLLGLLLAPAAAQDEIVYYKFDSGPGGTTVLNFTPNTSPAAREGTLVSSSVAVAWARGRFAWGLAGLQHIGHQGRVETGWAPNVSGDFTYAFFLRFGWTNPQPGLSYILGVPVANGLRAFVSGSTLVTAGIDGTAAVFATNADIWSMALRDWVHVAFVVDTGRGTATYYVNGARDVALPLGAGAQFAGPDFWVGEHLTSLPGSVFDLDEVRLLARAATPSEILAWASDSAGRSAEFGFGCGGRVVDENGPPTLGNGGYSLRFAGQPNAAGALALGGSRYWLGAISLPLDLGMFLPSLRGCPWYTSSDLVLPTMLDAQGGGAFGLGIPVVVSLLYRPVFVQALFSDGVSEVSSNALAISIGR